MATRIFEKFLAAAMMLGLFTGASVLAMMTFTEAALQTPNNSEAHLLNHILTNHSAEVRPVLDDRKPVVVRFGIALKQIVDLDVVNQIMIANVWIRLYWKNELITWNPEHFRGLKSININSKKLWVPDFTLYNSASLSSSIDVLYDKIKTKIIARHTGEMSWLSPAIITTECKMSVHNFPFDSQNCKIQFGSWNLNGLKMDLQLEVKHVDLSAFTTNKEWHLDSTLMERHVGMYDCCPEPYPSITVSLQVNRRAMFYVYNLLIPCGLITLLSLFSFILPANSGERVSFVITVMLALSVYMLLVIEKMPQAAETPVASKFFMCMIIQAAISLVITCFIIRYNNRNTPMPSSLKLLVNQKLAGLLLMGTAKETSPGNIVNVISRDNPSIRKDDDDLMITRVMEHSQVPKTKTENDFDNNDQKFNINLQDGLELRLVQEIKVLSNKIRQLDIEAQHQGDWNFFAEVLDRFFFFVSILVIIFVCVGVSSAVPSGALLQ